MWCALTRFCSPFHFSKLPQQVVCMGVSWDFLFLIVQLPLKKVLNLLWNWQIPWLLALGWGTGQVLITQRKSTSGVDVNTCSWLSIHSSLLYSGDCHQIIIREDFQNSPSMPTPKKISKFVLYFFWCPVFNQPLFFNDIVGGSIFRFQITFPEIEKKKSTLTFLSRTWTSIFLKLPRNIPLGPPGH